MLVGVVFAAASLFHGTAPARVQVVAREYSFTLSRLHVHAGTGVIELANFGQDPHDLRVQRVGARHIAGLGVVAPGARAELTVKLAPGRYSFWCSVANHRRLGMHGLLIVGR
ncbi:MAG: cupredoxin domain-containing protein [Gaiellaceae bacterium]